MSKPKKKCTKTRKRNRASHFALSVKKVLTCAKCKKPVLPHRACRSCGDYKGSSVFEKAYSVSKQEKTPAVEAK